jgi:hypothetical protein
MKRFFSEFHNEEVVDFDKWQGVSLETWFDNDVVNKDVEDEEYLTDECFYNGEVRLEDYLIQNYKGKFVAIHNYRWLVYGENTYDAGETVCEVVYVTSDGEIVYNCEVS